MRRYLLMAAVPVERDPGHPPPSTPATTVPRREFLAAAGAAAVVGFLAGTHATIVATEYQPTMYGLIGKITAVSGQRDALASIMLGSTSAMQGCLSYVIAADPADPDALWITEVWDSAASHKASLSLPQVQATIGKAKPLIAGFSNRVETLPLGGYGLPKR